MSERRTDRRGFLGRIAAAGALLGVPWAAGRAETRQAGSAEGWIGEVTGAHRCFFDFPGHKMGFPLVHILNYINTYSEAYGAGEGEVGAVGTFYGMGSDSSIAMGFNDAMWEKYQLGAYLRLSDASGRPYTRNVFHRPTAEDGHLLWAAIESPELAMFANAMVGAGIENLQSRGTRFILCNNALRGWTFELEARGKGAQAEIEADLRANLLPGVRIVPAMVIAIEQAQAAGIAYNKQ